MKSTLKAVCPALLFCSILWMWSFLFLRKLYQLPDGIVLVQLCAHLFDSYSLLCADRQGYHGDTSRMFKVGEVSEQASRLCSATTEALNAGIAVCKAGTPFKSIGAAIQGVADKYGYSLSRSFVGHGVGTVFHAYPHILHYKNNEPGVMVPGMTFTIEPMLCEGSSREKFWKDGWTAVTSDGGLSAQQEHTLLITETGAEILTVAE